MSVAVRRRAVEIQGRILKAAVAVHLLELQLVAQDEALGVHDWLLPGEHLADFHESFVFGLWDNKVDVDGHGEANGGKHQVAVSASSHLDERKAEMTSKRSAMVTGRRSNRNDRTGLSGLDLEQI